MLLAFACKKELVDKVVLPDAQQDIPLVVEGGVTTGSDEQYIFLSKPSFSAQGDVTPVNDAVVTINNVPLQLTSVPGVYSAVLLDNNMFGKAYHLKISCNGKSFEAVDTLKKNVTPKNSELNLRSNIEDGKITLSIPKHIFNGNMASQFLYRLPGGKAWSPGRFDQSQDFRYMHTYATPYALSPVLEQRTDYVCAPTDSVTVYQFSISQSYERYLYSLFQETDWKSLFSSNPGVIKGNVSGSALGFFHCSDVSQRSLTVAELIR